MPMAQQINLLPEELKPKGYALKLSKPLRQFALVSVITFFAALFIYLVSSFIISLRTGSLVKSQATLENGIRALGQTEQKFVLVEDRVNKIGKILSHDTAFQQTQILQTIVSNHPQNITIKSAKLDKDQAIIAVSTDSSQNLTKFITFLVNNNFKTIDLTSFSYDKTRGYDVEIAVSN
jgi:hypothetical protein